MSVTFAAPKRLENFTKLMNALKSGESVNLVIDYGKCKLMIDGKEEAAPKAIGGVTLSPWEYFAPGVINNKLAYVVGSETHLISSQKYKFVYNYVRTRIYEDGSVEITARYMTTNDYTIVMDETFKGFLSNGKDENAVSAFIKN